MKSMFLSFFLDFVFGKADIFLPERKAQIVQNKAVMTCMLISGT